MENIIKEEVTPEIKDTNTTDFIKIELNSDIKKEIDEEVCNNFHSFLAADIKTETCEELDDDNRSINIEKGSQFDFVDCKTEIINETCEVPRDDNLSTNYPCELCDYKATTRANLERHSFYKHGNLCRNYPCEICEYKATTKGNLMRHIVYAHDGGKYTCDQCDYTATQKRFLKQHVKSVHKEDSFQCEYCNKKFVKKKYLYRHKKLHFETFECTDCKFVTKRKDTLSRHFQVLHSQAKSEKKLICEYCDQIFDTKKKLTRHSQAHINLFECTNCKFVTNRKDNLLRHQEKCCIREQYMEIESMDILKTNELESVTIITSKKERKIIETKKNKSILKFKDKKNNIEKPIIKSKIIKTIICDICSKGFKTKKTLLFHKKSIHSFT